MSGVVFKIFAFVGILCFCALSVKAQSDTPCEWDPPLDSRQLPVYNPFGPCVPACNGKQTRCRTVKTAAIGNGGCVFSNNTDMGNVPAGTQDCVSRSCSTSCGGNGGGDSGDCLVNGTSLCQNSGICYKDAANNNQPACLCQAGFTGSKCETAGTAPPGCNPNPCLNGGICFSEGGANFTCQCPGNTAGAKCELSPCNDTTLCANSAQCVQPYGICDCSTASPPNFWYGPYCNVSIPSNQCQNITCKNGASCVVDYGYPRCACPKGWTGADCGTAGTPASDCDMRALIECMSKVTTSTTQGTPGKCDSYTKYGQCAVDAKCPGPLGLWCSPGGMFPLLTGCTVPACSTTLGSCNMTIFRSCFTGNSKGASSCDNAPGLAKCAAVSGCPDLLRTYCVSGCNNTASFPPECSNWVTAKVASRQGKIAAMDFEAFAQLGNMNFGGEAVRPRVGQAQLRDIQPTKTQNPEGLPVFFVVGVALVVVGMVVVGVAKLRRAPQQEMQML